MKGNKGFTLIELMIVVSIIGILSATAIMAYIGQQRRAAQLEAKTNLMNLRLLEEQFFAENGRYTKSLGTTGADQPGNINIIITGGGDDKEALRGFRPGSTLSFSYVIETGIDIAGTANAQCFRATAQGNATAYRYSGADYGAFVSAGGSRVQGDRYRIDCNNTRDF